jgi:hypothetical protein
VYEFLILAHVFRVAILFFFLFFLVQTLLCSWHRWSFFYYRFSLCYRFSRVLMKRVSSMIAPKKGRLYVYRDEYTLLNSHTHLYWSVAQKLCCTILATKSFFIRFLIVTRFFYTFQMAMNLKFLPGRQGARHEINVFENVLILIRSNFIWTNSVHKVDIR